MTQVSPTRGGQRLLLPGIDKSTKRFKRPLLSFRQVAADMGTTRPCGTCQIHIMPSDVAYCVSFSRGSRCVHVFLPPGEVSLPLEEKTRSQVCRLLKLPEHLPRGLFRYYYILKSFVYCKLTRWPLKPPYLATPPTTPSSLGRRNYLPPGNSGDGPLALNFQTPDRASQVFLSSIFVRFFSYLARRSSKTGWSLRSTRWSGCACTTLNTGCNSRTWRAGV